MLNKSKVPRPPLTLIKDARKQIKKKDKMKTKVATESWNPTEPEVQPATPNQEL